MTRVHSLRALTTGVAALLTLAAAWSAAAAQSIAFGSVSARVTDSSGRPVAGAEVVVVDRSSGAERVATTGRDGRVRFGLLSVALYDVTAEAIGYRPVVHLGVNVGAGAVVTLPLAMRPATPPVVARDTVHARAASAPPLAWLDERGYADVTGGRRLLSDITSLSPMADPDGIEGLPWRYAEVVVDGVRVSGVGHPGSAGTETAALAIPSRGLASARAGGVGFDVEMSGTGTGLVASTARGGRTGSWRSLAEGGTSGIGAAFTAGGAVQRDTAHAFAGGDYQRSAVVTPPWFTADDALGLQLADIATNTHGTDLSAYTRESRRIEERWSGFARMDWLQGDRFAVSFRASGTRLRLKDPSMLAARTGGLGGTQSEATAANASLELLTRLSPRLSLEMRLSGDVGDANAAAPALAPTDFAVRGVTVGGDEREPFGDARTTPRLSTIVHFDAGAHRLKAGFALASHRYESQLTSQSLGRFAFGDALDFAARTGSFRQVSPSASAVAFRVGESALFLQDAWTVTDALSLEVGLRFDGYTLSDGDYRGNDTWRATAGADAAVFDRERSRMSPRVGFRWALGSDRSWVLAGGAGLFHDAPDRRDLAEALALGRGATVRAAVGNLGSWPSIPAAAAPVGQTLSLLGPEAEGPRTQRMEMSLQRAFLGWTSYVSGVYRHTEFLTRRQDLNQPTTGAGTDQYGRPLVGLLRQAGAIVVADPGSNRRFAGFDAVEALDYTGYSEFSAVSIGVDRVRERGLSLAVNYTYAHTRDNLVDGGSARLSPFAATLSGVDWSDGASDRDAPHRGLVAVDLTLGNAGALRVGAIYRVRSGTPFTPGFAPGVDANGDGDAFNDPAYVDQSLTGMDGLLEAHPCLARQAGRFAARNSCRGDMQQRLDLRTTMRLTGGLGTSVDLVLDAMDVVSVATGRIDRALVQVNRAGTLVRNPSTGVTTVPLMVNPRFGEIVSDRSPGVLWRVGLRIGR